MPITDTGCDVSPSCLNCPLPQCKFENPAYTPHQSDKHRLYSSVYAARIAGETVNGLAERFDVSSRTVSRIIAAKGIFGNRKAEGDEAAQSSLGELRLNGPVAEDSPDDDSDFPSSVEAKAFTRLNHRSLIKARKPLPAYNESHDVTFRGGATAVYQKMCPRYGCDGDVHYQPGQMNCLQCGWVLYSSGQNAISIKQIA